MALNLTGLPEYVNQNSLEFVKEAVLGSQTIQLLKKSGSIQYGVKGKQAIQLLSVEVHLQDGSICGRNPIGNTTISQSIIEVVPIKDHQNICPKEYNNHWMNQYMDKGQAYTSLLFADDIMNAKAAKIAETNEIAIWQGDTSATGSTNYNRFDGFVKQIKGSPLSGTTNVSSSATGSTIVEKLQGLFISAPKTTSTSSDARVWIGTDKYQEYVLALSNKNIYKPTDDKTLFGTTIKLEPVDGLIGTGFALVAKPQHLVFGTDMLGEEDKAELVYSIETQNLYLDYQYAMGVVPVRVAEMAFAQI